MEDIRMITKDRPMFVRPPYWRFNANTQAEYTRHGLHMVLSDAKAYDGVDWGQHIFRRWNFRSQLDSIRRRMQLRDIPTVDGTAPVIVTFHDTNNYTTGHLIEYLNLLIDESVRVGLRLGRKPFYDNASEIMRAALCRAVRRTDSAEAKARPAEALLCQHK
jgi:peptidoglycan/xylan/chitin deacetylase (PgdA/CDA1 family)